MMFVVAYDVADERRRVHMADTLENFGTRVGYSVFECHLNGEQLDAMVRKIRETFAEAEDRVCIYPICSDDRQRIYVDGGPPVAENPPFRIL